MDARQTRLLVESVLLGVVGALAVELFAWLMNLSHGFFMGTLAGYTVLGLAKAILELELPTGIDHLEVVKALRNESSRLALESAPSEWETVAVVRGAKVLKPGVELEPGDQLLVLRATEARP